MIEILPESTDKCIGFKISGKITAEDYDVLLPAMDKAIEDQGSVNLLVLVEGLEGWKSFDAAKADFQFGTQQYRQVGKAAFVSDKRWFEWLIKVMGPFTRRTDERNFDTHQLDEAWAWILADD